MAAELERLIIDNRKMQDCRRNLQSAIQNLEGQLHIAQECLYYREARTGSFFIPFSRHSNCNDNYIFLKVRYTSIDKRIL